jgi:hypothetical protein
MSRYIFMILAGMLLVPQARPATSSAYYPVQFSALTSFNTSTWQPGNNTCRERRHFRAFGGWGDNLRGRA